MGKKWKFPAFRSNYIQSQPGQLALLRNPAEHRILRERPVFLVADDVVRRSAEHERDQQVGSDQSWPVHRVPDCRSKQSRYPLLRSELNLLLTRVQDQGSELIRCGTPSSSAPTTGPGGSPRPSRRSPASGPPAPGKCWSSTTIRPTTRQQPCERSRPAIPSNCDTSTSPSTASTPR